MYRKIIHIDMDSFFASVEQSEDCFNSGEREQARPKVKDVDFDDEHAIRRGELNDRFIRNQFPFLRKIFDLYG